MTPAKTTLLKSRPIINCPPNTSHWRSNGCLKFSTSKTEILISPQIYAYHSFLRPSGLMCTPFCQLLKLKICSSSLTIYLSPSTSQSLSQSTSLFLCPSVSLTLSLSLSLLQPPTTTFGLSPNAIIHIFTTCHPLVQTTIFA